MKRHFLIQETDSYQNIAVIQDVNYNSELTAFDIRSDVNLIERLEQAIKEHYNDKAISIDEVTIIKDVIRLSFFVVDEDEEETYRDVELVLIAIY